MDVIKREEAKRVAKALYADGLGTVKKIRKMVATCCMGVLNVV